jgi:hypothetical protein
MDSDGIALLRLFRNGRRRSHLPPVTLTLSIHLDDDGAGAVAGQEVNGRLDLHSETGAEVRQVTLTVGWRTEGTGNRARGRSDELTLLEDPSALARGETRSIPFRFQAPPGPLSYDGTHLKVVNVISASADVRWSRDPTIEREYVLRRCTDQTAGFQGPMLNISTAPRGHVRVRARPRSLELLVAIGAVLAGIGLALGATLAGASPPFLTLLILVAGLVVGGSLLLPFRSRIAEGRLGRVELVLDRATAVPGETIRAALTFQPRSDLRIQGAVATLRGKEHVLHGTGRSQTSRKHTFAHAEAVLSGERAVVANERVALWGELPLATDCPCSFQARDNRLEWEVEVRVALAGWPDWVASQRVVIWPARPDGAADAG